MNTMTQDTPAALQGLAAFLRAQAATVAWHQPNARTLHDWAAEVDRISQAATSAAGGATGKQPLPHVPKGFEIYYLKGFEALFDALNRAVEKGYLPDAMTEEWEAFDCMGPVAALAAQSPDSGAGPDSSMADAWEHSAADAQSQRSGVGERLYTEGLAEGMRICARDLRAALAQQGDQNG